jgi:hypothetical protein
MKANKKIIEAEKGVKFGFLGIILMVSVAVVIAGVGIYAFTNLTKPSETTSTPPEEPGKTLLTIRIGSQTFGYTLKDLTALTGVSGLGGYINEVGGVTGPNNYTGVAVSVLLSTIPALPSNYTFHAITSDGYTQNYSLDAVNGHVTVFNQAGDEIGLGTLTMIVAYKENGVLLNEATNGPLRIAFVYPQPVITDAWLWLSSLTEIVIM